MTTSKGAIIMAIISAIIMNRMKIRIERDEKLYELMNMERKEQTAKTSPAYRHDFYISSKTEK